MRPDSQLERVQRHAAGAIHDFEPRDAGEQRHAREPQREQQQRRAEEAQARLEALPDERAEDAAGGARIAARR